MKTHKQLKNEKLSEMDAADRLEYLAYEIEQDIGDKKALPLHMEEWGTVSKKVSLAVKEGAVCALDVCGTACCAGGRATQIPQFKKAGLKLVFRELFAPGSGLDLILCYRGFMSFEAIATFFRIRDLDANVCFDPSEYESIRARRPVIKRLREVANEYRH